MNAVHDFIATLISDPVMRERVLHVFSALPENVQEGFMRDPGFVIGIYDTGRWGRSGLLIPCPQPAQGSRLVALERSLTARSRAFAHYVIAHELAHALLRNRGRHPAEDPEVAADSLAAAWGFPRPATLPLLGADPRRTLSADREPKRSVVIDNRLVNATWTYHNATKHSSESVRTSAHFLDWPNQPLPFKVYSTLEPLPLPGDLAPPAMPALAAIGASGPGPLGPHVPDLRTLVRILFFSTGITRWRTFPGGEILFRAAACTGARYHIELYLVCGDLPDLEAGVYHFGVHDSALRKLRAGDHRGAVVKATAGEPSIVAAPAIIVSTATYWRNAWKYQARTYRHCFWDTGTILANLLAASAALEVPARIVCGFVDAEVNRLLDLDVEREVALTLIPLGRDRTSPGAAIPEVGPLGLPTEPLSKTEVDYPAIRAMHAASSLDEDDQVRAWRGQVPAAECPAPSGQLIPLRPPEDTALPEDSIARVIRRRGSTRQFAREPITLAQLSTMLDRSTRGVPADFLEPAGATLNDLYLIVHDVEGLLAGAYVFHRDRQALELLKEGNFRREAGYLGLEQELPADASVNVYFLADLPRILQRLGNRGYRATQLEAGVIGGKLYLSAYTQRLGATGLTFYDGEVTAFFSPHAAGKSVMFLIALGRSAKRNAERGQR